MPVCPLFAASALASMAACASDSENPARDFLPRNRSDYWIVFSVSRFLSIRSTSTLLLHKRCNIYLSAIVSRSTLFRYLWSRRRGQLRSLEKFFYSGYRIQRSKNDIEAILTFVLSMSIFFKQLKVDILRYLRFRIPRLFSLLLYRAIKFHVVTHL